MRLPVGDARGGYVLFHQRKAGVIPWVEANFLYLAHAGVPNVETAGMRADPPGRRGRSGWRTHGKSKIKLAPFAY